MPIQTTYENSMEIGFPGMLADSTIVKHTESMHNAEVSAEIPFGVAVMKGTNDEAALLPTGATPHLVGITHHAHSYTLGSDGNLGTTGMKPKATMNVLQRGRVYVRVEDAVVAGGFVFVRIASGAGGTQKGALRSNADTATAVRLRGARYLTSATAGGIAKVEIDIPSERATAT